VDSIVSLTDITARKHAEELQARMVAELNHRVKNVLTLVQAIAYQTARGIGRGLLSGNERSVASERSTTL
jgi:two-component sensor histidine kinase